MKLVLALLIFLGGFQPGPSATRKFYILSDTPADPYVRRQNLMLQGDSGGLAQRRLEIVVAFKADSPALYRSLAGKKTGFRTILVGPGGKHLYESQSLTTLPNLFAIIDRP